MNMKLLCELGEVDEDAVHYCERFLELLIDLEALLPTRRCFNAVMDDCHLVTRCHLSALNQRPEGKLFTQVSRFYIISQLLVNHQILLLIYHPLDDYLI